jgi:hypothetical protein
MAMKQSSGGWRWRRRAEAPSCHLKCQPSGFPLPPSLSSLSICLFLLRPCDLSTSTTTRRMTTTIVPIQRTRFALIHTAGALIHTAVYVLHFLLPQRNCAETNESSTTAGSPHSHRRICQVALMWLCSSHLSLVEGSGEVEPNAWRPRIFLQEAPMSCGKGETLGWTYPNHRSTEKTSSSPHSTK